jgi:hypothetical protein
MDSFHGIPKDYLRRRGFGQLNPPCSEIYFLGLIGGDRCVLSNGK